MQLHLDTKELNLVANVLMERVGSDSDDSESYSEILNMVLAHDLRLDSGQLELLAGLLAAEKRRLKEEMSRDSNASRNTELAARLALLQRTEERVEEACVMF